MANYGLIFTATLLIFAVSINSANGILKCWRCSSDATNGAFCNDPFEPDLIGEQQKYWSYVNCTNPYNYGGAVGANSRPVCKKLVQEIYGKRVISRSCSWEDYNDPPEKCQDTNSPSYVRTIFCRTCTTDGCNGAAGFVPIASLVLLTPVALIKLLYV